MKKSIYLVLSLFFAVSALFAQNIPPSFQAENVFIPQPQVYNAVLEQNISLLRAESLERERNGQPMRIAIGITTDLQLINKNVPVVRLAGGEQIRRQTVYSAGAYGLILTFGELFIPEGGILFVYTENREQIEVFTHETNPSGGMFATGILHQNKIVLEYVESTVSGGLPRIHITDVAFVYRSQAELRTTLMGCYINVGCSEGDNWRAQAQGVVGLWMNIRVTPTQRHWFQCSGSLINNVRQDGTPFILTAYHCIEGWDAQTMETMRFDFFRQSVSDNCFDQSATSPLTRTRTGAWHRASTLLVGGSDGSLLELRTPIPADWPVFFNGWDARNIPAASGVSIHHPNGMVQKISTFSQPLTSVGNFGVGNAPSSAWRVVWSDTENGRSVTYFGSSGSPIFNQNGHIVGTLIGGSSFCTNRGIQGGPNSPDFYGKFSWHWNRHPNSARHFSQFLDPDNTNTLILDGFDPTVVFDFEDNTPIATDATNITATGFTAEWDAVEGAIRYFLYVFQLDTDSSRIYADGFYARPVGNVTSFFVSGLSSAAEYFFAVRASAGLTSFSDFSNIISVITSAAFDNLSVAATEASRIRSTSFQANWEMLPEAAGYFLSVFQRIIDEEYDNDDYSIVYVLENFDVGNVLSYTIEGLEYNTQYFYTVTAWDGTYFSKTSNEIEVTTAKFDFDNLSVVATEATNVLGTSFQANWEMLPEAAGYFLSVFQRIIDEEYDGEDYSIVYVLENFDVGSVLSYTVEGLEYNTLYFYTVTAWDGTCFSKISNEISVTTAGYETSNDEIIILLTSQVFADGTNITVYSISSANLSIYTILGQLFLSKNISEGKTFLPTANFSPGVYIVRVGYDAHKIVVR